VLTKLIVTLPVLAYTASLILCTVHVFNFLFLIFTVNSLHVVSANWLGSICDDISKHMKKLPKNQSWPGKTTKQAHHITCFPF
jgi:hypothetical protein